MNVWPRARVRFVTLVIALTVVAIAINVPGFVMHARHVYGINGIVLSGNRVVGLLKRGGAPNQFRVGDVVLLDQVPIGDRYEIGQFSRLGPITKTVRIPVLRNGRPVTVLENFVYEPRLLGDAPLDVTIDLIEKTSTLLLALVGAALLLLRPSPVSWTFFFYTAGLAVWDGPMFWTFLPAIPYMIVSWVAIIYASLAPIMFALFALRLTDILKPAARLVAERIVVAVGLAYLIFPAIETVLVFTKPVGEFYYTVSFAFAIALLAGATAVFIVAALRTARTGKGVPVAASLCFAGAGLTLLLHLFTGLFLNFDSALLNTILPVFEASLYFPLSLAGIFIIVRSRTIDIKLTISRTAAFAFLSYAVIAVIVAANWTFARHLADYSFLIPLQLIFAVWLGYRLSGLGDLSRTFSLATSEATAARLSGDLTTEQQLLSKALAAAELTRKATLVAEVRARMAFSAWLDGDEYRRDTNLQALEAAIGATRSRGLRFYLAAARNQLDEIEPSDSDLAEWVARGYLIASTKAKDAAESLLLAREAKHAAEQSGQHFLTALALIANAELNPSASVEKMRERAEELARELASEPFRNLVRAYFEGSENLGVLEPFVRRFKPSVHAPPVLEVAFSRAEVRVSNVPVALREAERALLFAIAYRPGPVSSDALADELWPDRDGDVAKNALRVCMHRLRRALGPIECVLRRENGYALRTDAAVDLHEMPKVHRSVALPLTPNQRSRMVAVFETLQATEDLRAAAGSWFSRYAYDIQTRYNAYALTLCRDALRRGAPDEALGFVRTVLKSDPQRSRGLRTPK